jgi:ABC-2 type transport system ATP-binding protein
MTVEEIGRFATGFYPDGYWREYARLVNDFRIPADRKIAALSKGMRAKVSLSLAMAHDPELLILDEPTSGLDALVRREFLESMVDRAATGKTVFLSSHQIQEVERVSDYVAILRDAKLLLVERLDLLKAHTRILQLILDDDPIEQGVGAEVAIPFEEVLQQRSIGRQMEVIGRGLAENAAEILQGDPKVASFEWRVPTLEEIFIACMEGNESKTRHGSTSLS